MQYKNEREHAFIKTLTERKATALSWSQLVDGLYNNSLSKERLDSAEGLLLHQLLGGLSIRKHQTQRQRLREMLLHLDAQRCQKLLKSTHYLIGLFTLCRHPYLMIRPIKKWKRSSHSIERQFISLVNHCFVRYEVPSFLYQVWFDKEKAIPQHWFVDVGNGKSIRHAQEMPIAMTKKMAHFFGQAAEDFTVEEALRWAQAKGTGASDRVARAIAASSLGRNEFREETFWVTVIRFLVQQPDECSDRIGEVVDYIACIREQQWEFSMKGRTWNALWRQTEAWHEQLHRERKLGGRYVWTPSTIKERLITRGRGSKTKTYMLLELCSSKALATEGRKMRHCVSGYAYVCYKKRSAIFSLRVYEQEVAEPTTLATIEVNLRQQRIVQAKAKCNAPVSSQAQQMMEKWAAEEGLSIAPWL